MRSRHKPNLLASALLLAVGACSSTAGPTSSDTGATPDSRADAPTTCPVIQTSGGPVQGELSGGVCGYLGIPYAEPPIGPLRWKAPQPPALWTEPRPSRLPAYCSQEGESAGTTDEDCLYLNVWAPQPAAPGSAVMVYVHGGGFVTGSGSVPEYLGANLAATAGVVVVNFNYRLGPLGFLSLPALRAEDPAHPSAGNFGIEDQIAAFRWVKQNAAAFGSDPTKLTIFGESAGGMSMLVHLTSPKSQGLFTRVIVESGAAVRGAVASTTAAADSRSAVLANALGCTDEGTLLSCLRAKPADDVQAARGLAWGPVIDGFVLQDEPMKLFASGSFAKVPILLGTNKNEGTFFVNPPPASPLGYKVFADGFALGHSAEIVAQYPVASFGSYQAAAAEILTDAVYVCPTRRVARACSAAGVPTFLYSFAHPLNIPGHLDLGVFHGTIVFFVLGNRLNYWDRDLQPEEQPLSHQVMAYWGAMAANGDPNVAGQFNWPKYDLSTETNIVLDLTMSTETAYKKKQCGFWDSLAP